MQLILDCNAWLRWRIPYFNSFSYGLAAVLTSAITFLSAAYFILSAVRARRNLSTDQSTGGVGVINEDDAHVVSKATMRRLVRRVLPSGCLMLAITVVLAVGTELIFHPIGFTVVSCVLFPMVMANSLLQIGSFAPSRNAPVGPLQEVKLAVMRWARRLANRAEQWLASSSSANPNQLVRIAQHRRSKRASFVDQRGYQLFSELIEAAKDDPPEGNSHNEAIARTAPPKLERRGSLGALVHAAHATRSEALSDLGANPKTEPTGHDDQLKPWDHPGVSVTYLQAFVKTHNITADLTTTEVMETIIKPETAARKCSYVELFTGDDRCPPQWLGKTTHFASHW